MDKFFFPLGEPYKYGRELNTYMKEIIGNKVVQDKHATGLLCQAIVNAGDGDYVEIGSLYGGSAITALLTKRVFNLKGNIYCVDPNPKEILENAKLFGLKDRITIFKRPSEEIIWGDMTFSCGFIDGDHREPNPLLDWYALKNRVTRYIIFDDYDKSETGVVYAVKDVLLDYESPWMPVHISDAIVIFERDWVL